MTPMRRREVGDNYCRMIAQVELPCGCWVTIPWRYKRRGEDEDARKARDEHVCKAIAR